MIVKKTYQNIFDSLCPVKVNPVNCEGIMEAGLALKYKTLYPEMFLRYRAACLNKELKPGGILFDEETGVLNVATKRYHYEKSKLEYIEEILDNTFNTDFSKIAFPLIGCGFGGLPKRKVIDLFYLKFETCQSKLIELYVV